MAWEDVLHNKKKQFSLSEKQIITLMRKHLTRLVLETGKRVAGRKTRPALRSKAISRSHCFSNINKKLDKTNLSRLFFEVLSLEF